MGVLEVLADGSFFVRRQTRAGNKDDRLAEIASQSKSGLAN
jgi:hypothetical protein